jgi:hypothetical protein
MALFPCETSMPAFSSSAPPGQFNIAPATKVGVVTAWAVHNARNELMQRRFLRVFGGEIQSIWHFPPPVLASLSGWSETMETPGGENVTVAVDGCSNHGVICHVLR